MAGVALLISCAANTIAVPEQLVSKPSVIQVKGTVTPNEWLVVGPFPNPRTDQQLSDGSWEWGYYTDYLQTLGGEAQADFSPGDSIWYQGPDSVEAVVTAILANADSQGIVNYEEIIGPLENQVAYALCYLYSHKDQTVYCLLGSDDAVKVWANDELVHRNYVARAIRPGEDRFELALKKGLNPLLVKVAQGVREWGFTITLLDEQAKITLLNQEREQAQRMAFLNSQLVPAWYNSWDEYFYPGPFPELQWSKPQLAKQQIKSGSMTVHWYDQDLNQVEEAAVAGRYAYIVQGELKNGQTFRRAGTFYCMPWDWVVWSERPEAALNYFPAPQFDRQSLSEHQSAIATSIGRSLLLDMLNQDNGAPELMSYLHEISHGEHNGETFDNPIILDDEYHIRLQKAISGILYQGPALVPPGELSNPSPVLREGTVEEAGFSTSLIAEVDQVCQDWYSESGEPFILCLARNGVIVYEKAIGQEAGEPFTTGTATPMASISKLVTGITFAQFVDQGLIEIDDPVGLFFPDFPLEGSKALTLRHCFTHTSGLEGHERWGGVHNHRLENIISNQLDYLTPGEQYIYNGMGYDLGGRVMESVAGKSIFRIISENLFKPLGMTNTLMDEDLAFSCRSTAGDMARLGQMLLNRGSYGDYQFFSPETFEKFLPKNLNDFYHGINTDQGIGITWMNQSHPDAGRNGLPVDATILSDRVIGHGSATSAILRVDLENNLVITQTRRRTGSHYDKYLTELLLTIEQNLQ